MSKPLIFIWLIFSLSLISCNKSSDSGADNLSNGAGPVEIVDTTITYGVDNSTTFATDISVDSESNVFLTGNTNGPLDGVDLGGSSGFFLVKYTANGSKIWSKVKGTNSTKTAQGTSLAIDANGNIFAAGYTTGNFDGHLLNGEIDTFIIKYKSDGTKLWSKIIGASQTIYNDPLIATDMTGNAYLANYVTSNSLVIIPHIKITKFTPAGTKLWEVNFAQTNDANVFLTGITANQNGDVFICGSGVVLDGQNSTGSIDAFVSKFDGDGSYQWTKMVGVPTKLTQGTGVTTSPSGDIVLVGTTEGDLNGETRIGTKDTFAIKFDSAGNIIWTEQIGVINYKLESKDVEMDSNGDIYIAGISDRGPFPFFGQALDSFLVKIKSDGTQEWLKSTSNGTIGSTKLGVSPENYVFIGGTASTGINGEPLKGNADAFFTTNLNF